MADGDMREPAASGPHAKNLFLRLLFLPKHSNSKSPRATSPQLQQHLESICNNNIEIAARQLVPVSLTVNPSPGSNDRVIAAVGASGSGLSAGDPAGAWHKQDWACRQGMGRPPGHCPPVHGVVLRAPVPAKPGSACEPAKSAGSRKPEEPLGRLRLAPPLGTRSGHGGRGEGGSGAGRQGTAPPGRATPRNGGWGRWASPRRVPCPPEGGHPHGRSWRGLGAGRGEGQGWLRACCTPGSGPPRIGVLGNGGTLRRTGTPEEGVL